MESSVVKIENDLIVSDQNLIKEEATIFEASDSLENDLIHFQQEFYVKEEVMISNISDSETDNFCKNLKNHNNQLSHEENNKAKHTTRRNSENNLINCQQACYVKEEVMLSDNSDSENEVSYNDNTILRKCSILSENLKQSNTQSSSKKNNETKHTTNKNSENLKKSNNQLPSVDNTETKHTTERYVCTKCSSFYKNKYRLKSHQRVCGVSPFLKCELCDYMTNQSISLRLHLLRMHKELKTREVQLIFDIARIEEHKICGSINFIKLYCKKCEVNYITDNIDDRKCPQCSELTHLECLKCGKRYDNRTGMYKHLRGKCQPIEYFHCADCDYQGVFKRSLRIHIQRRHMAVEPEDYEKCRKCDKGFKHRSYLQSHERLCKELDLQCKLCPYTTKWKSHFGTHMQTHTLLEEVATVDADYADTNNRNLINSNNELQHVDNTNIRHTTGRYECAKCGFSYKNKYLKSHQRLCGLSPFLKCEFCDYKANQSSHLLRHLKRMHKDLEIGKIQKIIDTAKIEEHKLFGSINFIKLYCSKCEMYFKTNNIRDRKCPQCCELAVLQCLKCDKRYNRRSSMYFHLKSKCGPKDYFECADCDFRAIYKDSLIRHIQKKHMTLAPEDYDKCRKCGKGFRYRKYRLSHEKLCKEYDLQCKLCPYKSQWKSHLETHMQTHTLLNEVASVDTEYADTTNSRNLKNNNNQLPPADNTEVKHTTGQSKCTKCGLSYKNKYRLKSHQRVCGLSPFLKCELCSYKSNKSYHLRQHLQRMHKDLKAEEIQKILDTAKKIEEYKIFGSINFIKLYCLKCEVNFKTNNIKDRKCPQCCELAVLQCLKCDKRYDHLIGMYKHLRSKCQPKEYFHCADCDYRSVFKSSLRIHIEMRHMTVAPEDYEKCRKCGKGFRHRITRQGHERVCKEYDLQCKLCPYKSKWKSHFEIHMQTHVLQKKVATVDADYADTKNRNLKSNNQLPPADDTEIVHTIRPYKCKKCGSSYRLKCRLKSHQRLCGLSPFLKCEFCDYKANESHRLRKHLKRKHKDLEIGEIQKIIDTAKIEEHKIFGSINFIKLYCLKCEVNFKTNNIKDRKCPQCCELAVLQCLKCDKRYDKHIGMYKHLRGKCQPKEYFNCADCDYRCVFKRSLRIHIERRHTTVAPEDYEKCRKCGKGFRHRIYRQSHERLCKGRDLAVDADYTDIQNRNLEGNNQLPPADNTEIVHTTGPYKCKKCGSRYTRKYRLKSHQRVCGLPPFLKCQFCDYKTSESYCLRRHLRRMHIDLKIEQIQKNLDTAKIEEQKIFGSLNVIKLYCSKCKMNFQMNNIEDRTCPQCRELAVYQCLKCDKRYDQLIGMYKHLRSKCQPKEYFHCADCDFRGFNKRSLRNHIERWHRTVAPEDYEIENCDKGFRHRENRQSHDRLSDTERDLLLNEVAKVDADYADTKKNWKNFAKLYCSKCKKNFDLVTWKDQKCPQCCELTLLQCLNCDRRYENPDKMYCHVRNKCALKPNFHCADCDYRFFSRSQLLWHILRRHKITEKYEKCVKCGKGFEHRRNLLMHEMVCVKQPHLQCEYCPFKCKSKYDLKRHFKAFHSEIDEVTVDADSADGATSNDVDIPENYLINCQQASYVKEEVMISDISGSENEESNTDNPILQKCFLSGNLQQSNTQSSSKENDKMNHTTQNNSEIDVFTIRTTVTGRNDIKLNENGSFTCTKCDVSLKNRRSLLKHMRLCGLKPFLMCEFCDYKTKANHNLKRHLEAIHKNLKTGEIEYNIDITKAKGQNMIENEDYMKWIHKTEQNKCTKCDRWFKGRQKFQRHQTMCGLSPIVKCELCNYKTSFVHNLRKHCNRVHTDLKTGEFQKIVDTARIEEHKIFENEVPNHNNSMLQKSNILLKNSEKSNEQLSCEDNNETKRTTQQNSDWKNFAKLYCSKCNKNFELITWKDQKCPQCCNLLILQCLKCDKRYANRHSMYCHVRRKCGLEACFQCADCDYRFFSKNQLLCHIQRRHVIFAEDYKKCDESGKGSKDQYNLQSHGNLCNVEVDYCEKCGTCGKAFKRRCNRVAHEKFCGKQPNVQCEYCPYKCKKKYNMTRHYKSSHSKINDAKVNADSTDGAMSNGVYIPENDLMNCHQASYVKEEVMISDISDSENEVLQNENTILQKCILSENLKQSNTQSSSKENNKTEHTIKENSAKDSTNLKQVIYVEEEVMISDLPDFSKNDKSNNSRSILRKYNTVSKNPEKRNDQLSCEENNKAKLATQKTTGSEENDVVSFTRADTARNDVELDEKDFECTKCGGKYKVIRSLQKHQRICGLSSFLKCESCDYQTRYIRSLKRHLQNIHKILKVGEFQQIIGRAQAKEHEMIGRAKAIEHEMIGLRNFVKLYCSNCEVNFENCQLRDRKCPNCCELTLLQCLKCDRRYTNQSDMYDHLRGKCGPKEYLQCADCHYYSYTKAHLRAHIKRMHKTLEPPDYDKCGKCGKGFKHQVTRQIHERTCGKRPNLQCEYCPYKGKMKCNFERHMQNHILQLANADAAVNTDSRDRTTSDGVEVPEYTSKFGRASVSSNHTPRLQELIETHCKKAYVILHRLAKL